MNSEKYKNVMDKIKPSEELKNETFKKVTKKSNIGFTALKVASVMCVFVFTVFAINMRGKVENNIFTNPKTPIKVASNIDLPTVGSYDNLKEIIGDINYYGYRNKTTGIDIVEEAIMNTASTSQSETKTAGESNDYSRTNTQVENVDEADIVKTNGKNIFYLNNNYGKNEVVIVDCESNEIVNRIKYEKFCPYELFIYQDKLIVIGDEFKENFYQGKYIEEDNEDEDDDWNYEYRSYYDYGTQMTKAYIYDISDVKNEKEERTIEIEGSYISSRMINEYLYLISNKGIYSYVDYMIKPRYRDSIKSEEYECKDYNDIYYFPECEESNFMNIASVNVVAKDDVNIESFLGAGTNVYCSEKNMYITRTKYNYNRWTDYSKATTCIYKLELDGLNMTLKAQTELDGVANNQFSLDEYEGNLRIALTRYTNNSFFYEIGISDDYEKSRNTLYVLDENLNEIGKIDNMAVGEQIYSVRFIGNKGYVVTFKEIDPLFVLDLSDSTNPKVAGQLKIPGYSSYLHPYDENHIIGIGYNTKETKYGATTNDGVKMSMFDVTDPENPVEMFSVSLSSSSYSEATNNHKAVMVSKEKNIIAFPVTRSNYYYGSEAIVYNIDLEKGFVEAGSITNNENKEYNYKSYIRRIIYVKDKYYTLSNNNIVVTDMNTFEKIKDIIL